MDQTRSAVIREEITLHPGRQVALGLGEDAVKLGLSFCIQVGIKTHMQVHWCRAEKDKLQSHRRCYLALVAIYSMFGVYIKQHHSVC
jgi:hypothetical protein